VTESFALAAAGGAIGVGLAYAGIRLIAAHGAAGLPALAPLRVEPSMLLFAGGLSLVTTLLFGFAPALQTLRLSLSDALREGSGGASAGRRRQGLRTALASVQMALAVMLLLGAGLMVRTLDALMRVDLGFDPKHVLTVQLQPPAASYPSADSVVTLYRSRLEKVRGLPGVRAAGLVRSLPLASSIGDWGLEIDGYVAPQGQHAKGDWQVVSDGALEALGERLIAGRALTAADTETSQPVVLVNETLARMYFGARDPIGGRLRMGSNDERPWMTVVGVVKDERHNGLTAAIKEKFFVPYTQFARQTGRPARGMTLVVRAETDPMSLAAPVRAEVRRLDPNLPLANVRPMTSVVDASMATPRLTGSLLTVFAALALSLAAVGVAGVLAYLVSRRRREIGIRMALGASRAEVMALVVRRGLATAGVGILVGAGAAFFLTRLMEGLLFGVAPRDPATFAAAAGSLLVVALLASAVPALRAARVDPLEALRTE
jgi:predicted permease